MHARGARKSIVAIACGAVLIGASGAAAQVRAGFAGVAGGRMGGFSGMRMGGRGFAPMSRAPRMGGGPSARGLVPQPRRAAVGGPSLTQSATVGRGLGGGGSSFGRRTIVDGSGLTIKGSFTDDNFRLGFRLGTPTGLVCPPKFGRDHRFDNCFDPCVNPGFPFFPSIGYPFYSYYDEPSYPIDGYYTPIDPQLIGYTPRPTPPDTPPPPPTDREIGDASLYSGFPERAAAAYRAHLVTNADDAEVIRLLGLALIDARDPKEGVAVIGLAYRKDPALCEQPIPWNLFGGSRAALRTNVNRASIYAKNVNSASAWLAMTVLVQAEGRLDVASRLIERARAAGLDKTLADRMVTTLAK